MAVNPAWLTLLQYLLRGGMGAALLGAAPAFATTYHCEALLQDTTPLSGQLYSAENVVGVLTDPQGKPYAVNGAFQEPHGNSVQVIAKDKLGRPIQARCHPDATN